MKAGVHQLREFVVEPVMRFLEPEIPYSLAAVEIVMGTGAQESDGFRYIDQLGGGFGPGVGVWQCERATHEDIWWNYLRFHPSLAEKLLRMHGGLGGWAADPMRVQHSDLAYGAAICRVHYRRVKGPLPPAGDPLAQGAYWKEHYNTHRGKGTVEQFVKHYREAGLAA